MLLDALCALFLLALLLITIVLEVYFLYAILISKICKYPPAFPSFGNMKKLSLQEAEKILADSKKAMRVIDLGCGTGTMLLPLAKKFPQHQFEGYDWDRVVVQIIKWKSKKLSNVKIIRDNFMNANIAEYDLILCFLETQAAVDLSTKMQKCLHKGAVVISNAFELEGMIPDKILDAKSFGMPLKIYVYTKK